MGLFDRLKTKTKTVTVTVGACVSGKVVKMADIPDPVFAEGILGFTAGIEPEDEKIIAPADGVITQIADSLHAIGLKTKDGAEILIHVGIDTVQMMGDGFCVHHDEEAKVKAGEVLITFDKAKILEAGYAATVITAVTNADDFSKVTLSAENTVRAGDCLLTIEK